MGARCGVVTKELFNASVNQVNVLWKRVKVITMYWEAIKKEVLFRTNDPNL